MKTEDLLTEAKQFFEYYKKDIGKSIKKGTKSIEISFQEIASFSHELSDHILLSPEDLLQILELALDEMGIATNARVRLTDLPSTQKVMVRNIRAKHLNQLISVEGIIRQASDVRPQVINAKFECPSCGTIISVLQIDKKFTEPSRCSCGRRGNFRLVSKDMVDAQRIVIEESPESLFGGEQPRRMAIFLKEDLVDPKMEERTTPGSRVLVNGVLKEVPVPLQTGAISTKFDLAIEANNLIPLEETFEELAVEEEEEREIKELAADPRIFEKLAGAIAPSVYGYDEIKHALVLQLFGGVKKTRSDGTSARGDIHILLVGDPGVAKSVILKFISSIAPKGRYVAGRAATGAGLTATVVRDEFLKGWALEAGAMVLSNRGVVCIDELEKMAPEDRTAMHEAMEQQCYHYDTIISLANGEEVRIGEFVERMLEENKEKIIQGKDCLILPTADIEILTTDFTRIFKTKASRISKHKAFDKFVKIKFSNGREITVTPEHPIFIAENGEIITKRADLVKIGDPVPIPLKIPIEGEEQYFDYSCQNARAKQHITIPIKNGSELFKILGYLISEGSRELNRGKIIGINFTNKDKTILDEFEILMKKVFDLSPIKQARVDEHEPRYCYRYISTELASFILNTMPEILRMSDKKQIPQFAMKARKEDLAKMLSALFEGDGYASIKDRTIRIGYKTKSRRLAEQIQDLLLRFNVRSSITNHREFFRVGITDYRNIKNFQTEIGFVSNRKNSIISNYLKEKTIRRFVKNKIPIEFNDKVIEIIKNEGIRKVGKYREYDIIYDHSKRRDKFSFSVDFINKLIEQVKSEDNKKFLSQFTGEIGWERVSGIEFIDEHDEKWVYDITVEPNHAFVSQAVILHNTVTISKANVQAMLRAETSVLGAANPQFGRFDPYKPIAQQIDLPPTLINRFDVMFIMRDLPERVKDEAIASHVLQEHKKEATRQYIEPELFRKYVAYAKQHVKPELTDKAVEEIKKFYVELRNAPTTSDQVIRPVPITARQLDALIRLSEASARARLSSKVKEEDAKRAVELLKFYLMHVGFDYETKQIDIDRIATGVPASKRSKIVVVREAVTRLESRIGQLIPIEELKKELEDKLDSDSVDEAVDELNRVGDIFIPRKGFIQRVK
jgi:replicative DNA helicase Mcm